MNIKNKKTENKVDNPQISISGYSIVELIIVLVILAILSAISIPYLYNYRTLYKSEEESIKIMDLMKETGQMALTRRRTFRFEIDLTANRALIIDENGAGTADDSQIKSIPIDSADEIRFDTAPTGITQPSPPNYNVATFANDTLGHQVGSTRVTGNNVWAARFRSNGTVVNGTGGPISATLFVWAQAAGGGNIARNSTEVRAVTIFGGTGAVRYWKYNGQTFLPYK